MTQRGDRFWSEASYEIASAGAYVKAALLSRLHYTSAYAWDMASSLLAFAVVFLVWARVLTTEHSTLPFNRSQLFAYLSLAYALSFALSMPLETLVGQRVRSGLVATDLLRPIDFQWMCFLFSVAEVLAQTTMSAALLSIAWLAFPLAPLAGLFAQPLACAASLALAVLVQYALCFLFATLAFVTHYNYGSYYLRVALQFAFSGITAPLALMRPTVQTISRALPFAHVLHTPAGIMMGFTVGVDAWKMIGAQACWAATLIVFGRFVFARCMRRLVIQGG